jgi:hypothetical protein
LEVSEAVLTIADVSNTIASLIRVYPCPSVVELHAFITARSPQYFANRVQRSAPYRTAKKRLERFSNFSPIG